HRVFSTPLSPSHSYTLSLHDALPIWPRKQFGPGRHFHHAAQVEHHDTVAQILDHVEVVRDEQHGQREPVAQVAQQVDDLRLDRQDRKSTRLNSSHEWISYAVFCLKKK